MPILTDAEIDMAHAEVCQEYTNPRAVRRAFARRIERMTAERVNPRIITLRRRWLPVRLVLAYRMYREHMDRRAAWSAAWRISDA